jgi:membrane-bound lytic murein transglycosylase D
LELTEPEKQVVAENLAKLEETKRMLDFSFTSHPVIAQYLNYYQGRGRATMQTGMRRSGLFLPMARRIFREEGVPEDLVWMGQVESWWRPTARSWVAASGLWQLIPSIGARFGLRQTAYVDERNGFEKPTRASAKYLKLLSNRYKGNWELAIAAYNTGEVNIDRAIVRAGAADFWAIYPYIAPETRNHVPNILATVLIAKAPEKYGFSDVQRMAPLTYDVVSVPTSTSLHLVASLTYSNIDHIRALNPELRRDVTPPGESYHVRVPAGRGRQLVTLLKRIPADRRNQKSYVINVQAGEDLQAIAARTGTSVARLQMWNSNVDLERGGQLVVPGEPVRSAAEPVATDSRLINVRARAGETITQIGFRYRKNPIEIASLNGLPPNVPLRRNQEITVRIAWTEASEMRVSRSSNPVHVRADSRRISLVGRHKSAINRRQRVSSNVTPGMPGGADEADDPVATALSAAINSVEKGEIVFQPAQEMTVGETQRVEIAIAKQIQEEVAKQIGKGNKVNIESITIGAVMKAQLRGDNFEIKQISEERQVLQSNDASEQLGEGPSRWAWDVMPTESGNQKLTLTVDVRAPVPGYSGEMALYQRVFDRDIYVKVNRTYTIKKFLTSNWQYFLTGLGGVVTSVCAFFFGQYWKSRAERKKVKAQPAARNSPRMSQRKRRRH